MSAQSMVISIRGGTLYSHQQPVEKAHNGASDGQRNINVVSGHEEVRLGNREEPMHGKLARAVRNCAKCNRPARARCARAVSFTLHEHKRQREIPDYQSSQGEPEGNGASLGLLLECIDDGGGYTTLWLHLLICPG